MPSLAIKLKSFRQSMTQMSTICKQSSERRSMIAFTRKLSQLFSNFSLFYGFNFNGISTVDRVLKGQKTTIVWLISWPFNVNTKHVLNIESKFGIEWKVLFGDCIINQMKLNLLSNLMQLLSIMNPKSVPLVVIIGATGCSKTRLSLELAKRFDGEIISADSMQVYKGLDIITNKATPEERQLIPHHLIDFLEPTKRFTVYDFSQMALQLVMKTMHSWRRGSINIEFLSEDRWPQSTRKIADSCRRN